MFTSCDAVSVAFGLYSAFQCDGSDNDVSIPSFKSVKSSLYYKRSERLPPQPQSLSEVKIEGEWTKTKAGLDFLQIDDGTENRILVFFTIPNQEFGC